MDTMFGAPRDGGRHDLRDEDLEAILASFYEKVGTDPLLEAYFFDLNMATHMPRIVGFWSTLLFHTSRYSGNAFAPHQAMPGLHPEHFARWVETLESIVDANVAGENAEQMKALAHRIAYSMQLRLGVQPFTAYRPFGDQPRAV